LKKARESGMTRMQARPTSIRIFLADGVPEGLRIKA
jgi:hypothetical protein